MFPGLSNDIWISIFQDEMCFLKQRQIVSPRDSDHSARHHPHQVLLYSKEGSVRTTIAKRNPKPLGAAERDVESTLSGRAQHAKRQQVCSTASQSLHTAKRCCIIKLRVAPRRPLWCDLTPPLCARSTRPVKSSTLPSVSGYWTSAPLTSFPLKSIS